MARITLMLIVSASLLALGAETCYWTGGGYDTYWSNPRNWKDGNIPGQYQDGEGNVIGRKGDVAVFGQIEAGKKTTITCLRTGRALVSIGRIVVTGAEAPTYTFGGYASDEVHIEGFGEDNGFFVEEGVSNMPVIQGKFYALSLVTNVDPVVSIRNDGVGILDLPDLQKVTKDSSFTGESGTAMYQFFGSGDIRLNGQDLSNTAEFRFGQTGRFIVNKDLESRISGCYAPRFLRAIGPASEPVRLVINKGCALLVRKIYNNQIVAEERDLAVSGEGWFGVQSPDNQTTLKIGTDRILSVDCVFKAVTVDTSPYVKPQSGSVILQNGTSVPGTLKLTNPLNEIAAGAEVRSGGTLEISSIGAAGEQSVLGTGTTVTLSNQSTLRYVGAGETTTRDLLLTKDSTCGGKLQHDGTGPWTFSGSVTIEKASGKLTLTGARADGTLATALADSGSYLLSLVKAGTGTWTLTGACTQTGTTTVSGGTLVVGATGSVAASPVSLEGGTLVFDGDGTARTKSLLSLASTKSSSLVVKGATTLTVGSLGTLSGTVDIRTDNAAAVTFADSSLWGAKPEKLTWNGAPSRIGEDGTFSVDADAVIGARGDVVPTGLGSVYIAKEGTTGPDTLAADETTVGVLGKMTSVPAVIAVGVDQSLVAEEVKVIAGSAGLTIGDVAGRGRLASAGTLLFENGSSDATITVNAEAAFGAGAKVTGAGETVFAGGATTAQDVTVENGTLQITGLDPFVVGDVTVGPKKTEDATLVVSDANIRQGRAPTIVGAGATGVAHMVITNSAWVNDLPFGTGYSDDHEVSTNHTICIGHRSDGLLEIQSGAVISNRLAVGGQSGLYDGHPNGAVVQTGGILAIDGADYRGSTIGHKESGYFELVDGLCAGIEGLYIGGYGYGYFLQKGGTLRVRNKENTEDSGSLRVQNANGQIAQFRMTGGSAVCGSLYMSVTHVSGGGKSAFVMDGTNAAFSTGKVVINQGYSGTWSHIVLNAGAFACNGMSITKPDSFAYLSFNGGTLVPRLNSTDIFNYQGTENPISGVVVHDGGAVIDTDGRTGTVVSVPIEKATGKGVIGVVDFTPLADRIGAPVVWITGDGTGAVAVAEWDLATRTVTGVRICAPGFGYTTATVTLYDHGGDRVENYAAILGDNAGKGSFTKAGAGDLTLSAANTWGGDTVLAGGTLALDHAAALPTGTTVVFQGGTVEANGHALPTRYAVEGTAVAAAGKAFGYDGSFAFPAGSELTLRDFDMLTNAMKSVTLVKFTGGVTGAPAPQQLAKDWKLSCSGRSIRLVHENGLVLVVR